MWRFYEYVNFYVDVHKKTAAFCENLECLKIL